VLCLEDFDASSLSGHKETRRTDFRDPRLALRAEEAEQLLAAIEILGNRCGGFFVTAQGGRIEVLKAKHEDGKKYPRPNW